jgi:hypothetical protein
MGQDETDVIEAAAQELIGTGASPIEAIKAIVSRFGLDLGAAKTIVHGNLSPAHQRAAEALWDEVEEAVGRDGDASSEC